MAQSHVLTHQRFWHRASHQQLLFLALPMILSNITTPLIGMVDTAVLGHMGSSHYLAGAAIASLILTQTYWLCGFIRMSSTGLSAQAKGQQDGHSKSRVFWQSCSVALVLGLAIWAAHKPLLAMGIHFAQPETQLLEVIQQYFSVRIAGAPAALVNLAIIGWLIGQQKTTQVLYIQVFANLLNAGLSVLLVFVFDAGVKGVAVASVVAEYSILLLGVWVAFNGMGLQKPHWALWRWSSLAQLMSLNGYSFVRNLALQLCLAFVIFQGARFGPLTAASNAIIMQFFALIALGLDGIAYAVEALTGEAKGKRDAEEIKRVVVRGLFWSGVIASLYSLCFVLFGQQIIAVLTDLPELRAFSAEYLLIIWLLPIVSHWCFLLDGVFVGLTRAKAMQNSMLLSALCFFFPSWWLLQGYQNYALWIALLLLMLGRGLSLGGYFAYLYRGRRLLG
ncbi:MATE family efflux transporter [Paraglaciecola polaris]|uniref:DNA-damage-inducible protein F n=1 Tax=Paraglaciecola polaris LMG 21857 TaxID=1129793 RepID=K6ZLM5_9ALTE|nr:MATE family efflux transporter [Paraglaciecola polaris]GAC31237.1 DNA-damage-inducible protein F [Paraglaciecola polaris LMG 21857]